MLARLVLALTLAVAVCAGGASSVTSRTRHPRDTSQWLALISDIARLGAAQSRLDPLPPGAPPGLPPGMPPGTAPVLPPPITLNGPGGTTTIVQLVLVPVPSVQQQCAPTPQLTNEEHLKRPPLWPLPNAADIPTAATDHYYGNFQQTPFLSAAKPLGPELFYGVKEVERPPSTNVPSVVPDSPPLTPPPAPPVTPPAPPAAAERRARMAPYFPPTEDSTLLLQQFREQIPSDPTLPPIVLEPVAPGFEDDILPTDSPIPTPNQPAVEESLPINTEKCLRACKLKRRVPSVDETSPPLPRFERSMMMDAVLTVPRAGYSEPYTVWWDAASGGARVDYHGGTASTYRMFLSAGRVQYVLLSTDRAGTDVVRRCVTLSPHRASLAQRAPPALPDLTQFTFGGHVTRDGVIRAERWVRTVRGVTSHGDTLTTHHELLVRRSSDNYTVTPLRYAVTVDSTLLGDNCDGYEHRYNRVVMGHHDPAMFQLNFGDSCDQIETTDQMHIVEPLREFTMLQRDPRYDEVFQRFKELYSRTYADELEEAIRKLVLINTNRFVSSGNREGATFEMEVNFMGDRLAIEQNKLLGVMETPSDPGESFPHTTEELNSLRGRLPQKFSWVELGGVTHVRNQQQCSSCWAFAVTGAVEGALFAKSGRLVPLSEQSIVDCGEPYGTHGCNSTWPNFAYEYVKHRGLPALDEYPYEGKVGVCRGDTVQSVTRITGHVNVTARSIIALKVALRRHGPTVVLIDAQTPSFISHKRGVYYDAKCRKNSSNHAVLAVGWRVSDGHTYFRLKNSWTTAWGEDGYIWIRGDNTCGVLRYPSYPIVNNTDILRVPSGAPRSHT